MIDKLRLAQNKLARIRYAVRKREQVASSRHDIRLNLLWWREASAIEDVRKIKQDLRGVR